MNKNLRTLNNNILNNIDLEKSMASFLKQSSNQYFLYGSIRLSFHYYTFYETYYDNSSQWGKEAIDLVKELNQIISNNVNVKSNSDLEKAVKDIDNIRNTIMKRMKTLIAYADIFAIYEFVLNRVEYRFNDQEDIEDDDEFAREILRYIFDSQDNLIINEKIRDIVGQLPVRMTKQKYYDIIRESFSNYIGAEWTSLQSYLYTLRTNASIYKEEDMETEYPWLWKQRERLSQIDYKNLAKDQYNEMVEILKMATAIITEDTEIYYSLQELVNETYALLLCKPYIQVEEEQLKEQIQASLGIIKGVSDLFIAFDKKSFDETILDNDDETSEFPIGLIENLSKIEGVQEDLSYDIISLEEGIYQANVEHRELAEHLKVDKMLDGLLLSKDLLSTSLFIDFYEIKTNKKVKQSHVDKEAEKLIKELSDFMESHDRFIGRAVMASTLSAIPVFFKDHKEVMEYVRYSLEKCTDRAEKIACNKIINDMITEY